MWSGGPSWSAGVTTGDTDRVTSGVTGGVTSGNWRKSGARARILTSRLSPKFSKNFRGTRINSRDEPAEANESVQTCSLNQLEPVRNVGSFSQAVLSDCSEEAGVTTLESPLERSGVQPGDRPPHRPDRRKFPPENPDEREGKRQQFHQECHQKPPTILSPTPDSFRPESPGEISGDPPR